MYRAPEESAVDSAADGEDGANKDGSNEEQVQSMKCDRAVFLMNVIALMTEPLLKADFANERVKLYLSLIDEQKAILTDIEGQRLLTRFSVADKLTEVRSLKSSTDPAVSQAIQGAGMGSRGRIPASLLNSSKELHPVSLSTSLKSFYQALFQGGFEMPHADRLQSRELKAEVRAEVSAAVADSYEELYEAIDPQIAQEVFSHAPSEVRTLLS